MHVTEEKYQQIALADPSGQWELDCGRLRRKPDMTFEHNRVMQELGYLLRSQLRPAEFQVRSNAGRMRRSARHYYIPDVMVIPEPLTRPLRGRMDVLEAYPEPLPLVVEVWSPSTGGYDVDAKLPEYQRRGDLEIWRIHPYERTLIAWRRQPDGSYRETYYQGGLVQPAALPNVTINLDTLFAG